MILNNVCVLISLPFCVYANILLYFSGGPILLNNFKDMPSAFGGQIPYYGLQAKVKYAEPADGCESIKPSPSQNTSQKWVALISKDNCTFELKIRNAQSADYDGVIVHNIGSDAIEEMSVKNTSDIIIPSLFISEYDGLYLKRQFLKQNSYFILITPQVSFTITTFLPFPTVLWVYLSVIFLLIVIIFMVIRCIKNICRQRRQRLSTSPALIETSIHTFAIGDPYETCAICLDDYVKGENLRVLPCAHAYHSKCIEPWFADNSRLCPVCKRRVLVAGEGQASMDSYSDDDTTPLISRSNQNRQNTGGGTFTRQIQAHNSLNRIENRGRSIDVI